MRYNYEVNLEAKRPSIVFFAFSGKTIPAECFLQIQIKAGIVECQNWKTVPQSSRNRVTW